jgi:hypothetical protein
VAEPLFTAGVVPALSQVILPNPRETRLADLLPFGKVLPDGRTIQCRDGTICQVLEVTGVDDTFLMRAVSGKIWLALARKDWVGQHGCLTAVPRCGSLPSAKNVPTSAPG